MAGGQQHQHPDSTDGHNEIVLTPLLCWPQYLVQRNSAAGIQALAEQQQPPAHQEGARQLATTLL